MQVFQIFKRALIAPVILSTIVLFTGCTKDEPGLNVALNYSISGNANSSQAVPKNNSGGIGAITGTYNASTKVMTYTTTWSNLTGAPLAGGLYTGASGVVGTSITAWNLGTGLSASGSFSASTTLSAAQETELLAGRVYYIFTTAANASGEIRGQVTATAQ